MASFGCLCGWTFGLFVGESSRHSVTSVVLAAKGKEVGIQLLECQ